MTAPRFFCRDASLARGESLMGTASTVRRWILVERASGWHEQAIETFDGETRALLRAAKRASGARVLLIRRHGMRREPGAQLFAAFTGRGRRWLEQRRLADLSQLADPTWEALRRGHSVGLPRVSGPGANGLRFFVCTHGRHDACCARHGRPVAEALDAHWPKQTWETSHIGGDRLAGNILVLPLGIYYGRVDPGEAVAVMQRLAEGELSLPHYRGRTFLPFAAQAAEWHLRQDTGLTGVDELTMTEHRRKSDGHTESSFVARSGRAWNVSVAADEGPLSQLTCQSTGQHRATVHRLIAIRPG